MSTHTRRPLFLLITVLALSVAWLPVSLAAPLDATYQTLPFSQNWSNTGLITTDDDWSGVPGIVGYRGDNLTSATNVDPQTVLVDDSPGVVDVNANQTNPNTYTTGGVTEFHITDPVVALQGSGTADAPYLLIHINTTGFTNIQVSYNLRDIDGSTDNAVQQVALHYRIGGSGSYTNVPAAYVADATTGPSLATLVTPVNVTLPAAVDNQPQVQLRIMTTNASGNDEWVGIDDISITGTPIAADTAPSVVSTSPANGDTGVAVNATVTVTFSEAVTFNSTVAITCTGSGLQNVTPTGGPTTWTLPHTDFLNSETCTVTVEATDVSDVDTDDPPDNMAADYQWSFTTVAAGGLDLIVNEVDADTPGTDALEFVELYDGGAGNSALDGYVVVFYNGNDDKSYAAFDLDTYSTDANGYFVLGNSAVPGVDLVFANNTLQNGADAVAVYLGSASDFPNGTSVTTANLVDAIVYDTDDADDPGLLVLLNPGQPQVNENGTGKGADYANQRCPNGTGGARNTDTYKQFPPTPAEANLCPSFIHEIQGSGDTVVPGTYTVEAIVSGDYQGATGVDDWKLDGFFLQEEDRDVDASASTSEGIFVFCGACPTNVVVGDKVRVTGTASDYFGMSQLSATSAGAVTVVSSGNPLPTAAAVTLPVPGVTGPDLATAQAQLNAYFEPFEGMLVTIGETLSVTEYFELYRYGQLVLSQGGRLRQFTDANAPSTAGYTAHQIDKLRRAIILDDDSNQQNHALMEDPDIPVFHPIPGFSITNYVRGGDTITGLTGVLHWSFAGLTGTDAWRIRPVLNASNAPVYSYAFTSGNARPAAPAPGGNVKVASFNVLNYFTTLNARGADSTAELERQATKIAAAFAGLNADVIGVMEIENNNDVAIADLVSRLNASAGAGTYAYIATGTVGADEITVGIIYKPAKVTPVGAVQTLTAAAFTDPNSTGAQRNRPAVAQTFEENTWGERFTVVVNHLKSKGSCPASGPDTDQGDGQGCWNDTRQKAATYLVNTWIPSLATSSGDPDFLIVGDLNSYRQEDPITSIKSAGYADLLDTLLGAPAYSYVFDGQLGYLDHALSNASLTPQVTGVGHWHINADEVNLLDYNDTIKDGAYEQDFEAKPIATELYEPNAYRASDHDPVLAGLGLYPDLSDLAAYGVAWHTGQGALWRLGATWTGEATSGTGTDTDDGVTRDYAESWNDSRGEVYVTVTGPDGKWACLNAWLDYSDGSAVAGTAETPNNAFDSNEHVVNNLPIQPGANQLVTFGLESGVINGAATYNMRFRLVPAPDPDVQSCAGVTLAATDGLLAPAGGASPTGRADGGEVEDHSFSAGPLAVTLATFSAQPQTDHILLTWESISEQNNTGFNVYRSTAADGAQVQLAFVASSNPGSLQGASYDYRDTEVAVGITYWYWLEDVDTAGVRTLHGPVSATYSGPTAVTLSGLSADGGHAAVPAWSVVLAELMLCLAIVIGWNRWRRRAG